MAQAPCGAEEVFHAQGRPEWTGKEDIAGKTLFIEAEQGLGDTIQFCRYAPLAAERGAHVVMTAQASPGGSAANSRSARRDRAGAPPCRTHSIITSRCSACRWRSEPRSRPFPPPFPICMPNRSASARMRERIGGNGFQDRCLLAGLLHRRACDPSRCACLEDIARSAGRAPDQPAEGRRRRTDGTTCRTACAWKPWARIFREDFADTAAAMEAMDLVISCDTSVAHLAGALGRPAWVALRHARGLALAARPQRQSLVSGHALVPPAGAAAIGPGFSRKSRRELRRILPRTEKVDLKFP